MNPYAYLRQKCGLTIRRFCDTYGFSKQTIISIEAGTYPELSARMIISMGKACYAAGVDAAGELMEEYGTSRLNDTYKAWRKAEQELNNEMLMWHAPRVGEESPMALLVGDAFGSVQGFAKRMKIPAATLMRYANGLQAQMPKSIRVALSEAKYPYTSTLEQMQEEWVNERL